VYYSYNTLKDKNYIVQYGDQKAVSEIGIKYTKVNP